MIGRFHQGEAVTTRRAVPSSRSAWRSITTATSGIFFTKIGHAIHGTYAQRNLGQAVSHGCVWLSVKNAATLWKLVKQEKMANTSVVLSGGIQDAGPVAMPLNPDDVATYPPVIHLNLAR
jgi:hypothetical protein